jgi:hypothetical protein
MQYKALFDEHLEPRSSSGNAIFAGMHAGYNI